VSSRLRNLPDKALYGYDPTAYFGVYMPDTFWLGES
jgi:peptide/nickel transport system substrate-binding protein